MNDSIELCAQVADLLWKKGWAERNGGNLMVRLSEEETSLIKAQPTSSPYPCGCHVPHLSGCYFYSKASGHRMRDVAHSPMHHGCMIRIMEDGEHYEILGREPLKPTSEVTAHLMIHEQLVRDNSPHRASLHSHPTTLVALSHIDELCEGDTLTKTLHEMIPEARLFVPRGINIVPYLEAGSQALAEETVHAIRNCEIVLWRKHGALSVGPDIMEAFDTIDIMEKAADIYWRLRSIKNQG